MIIVEELHGSLKRQQVFDHSERISESTFAQHPQLHDSTRFNTTDYSTNFCCNYCVLAVVVVVLPCPPQQNAQRKRQQSAEMAMTTPTTATTINREPGLQSR